MWSGASESIKCVYLGTHHIYNVGVFNLKYEFGQLPVNITNNSLGRKEGRRCRISKFFFFLLTKF